MAARSGVANIVEGNMRRETSRETEMKLIDVARASIAELKNDYFDWIISHGQIPWSVSDDAYQKVQSQDLDYPEYTKDLDHESALHILQQKAKYDQLLINPADSIAAANLMLILTSRLIAMLNKQLSTCLTEFKNTGGFSENLTAERLATRIDSQEAAEAPRCPICNSAMVVRVAKRGVNCGKKFLSCAMFPQCNGTLPYIEQ